VRIHPLLHWTELNVWEYIQRENIPVTSLYFADRQGKRYRSLGCAPCTIPINSNARTVADIIEELKATTSSERSGRAQDQEDTYAMQKLRARGYM
jgi:sulfate adenylyltransferase subunit 2